MTRLIHGRGFLKIKAECKTINAPLPIIDAENGGVSVSASGCEQYMSILRYGQVGADGVWKNKERDTIKKVQNQIKEYRLQDFCDLLGFSSSAENIQWYIRCR